MENFKESSTQAQKMIFSVIKKRITENQIPIKYLTKILNISESDLISYLNLEKKISLDLFFQLLGATEIRPQFIYSEDDEKPLNRIFHN